MFDALDGLRSMMLIRAFETALSRRPDRGFQLLSSGEEAVAVGVCAALAKDDQLLTGGRSIGAALARGVAPKRVMAELLGKSTGTNRGKGGRGHMSEQSAGFFGAHAVVGGNISIAAGVALARQLSGDGGTVTIVFGDGACGAGVLHEVLNIAAIWKLPLLFVCNNNQLSVSTPRAVSLAPKSLSDLALAYGIQAQSVDGMDLAAVFEAAAEAMAGLRSGHGPYFLECVSWRFASHSTSSRETRGRAEMADVRARCPIARLGAALTASGELTELVRADLDLQVNRTVAEALAFADASPYPDMREATTDVW
jgi:pyruvate dehydrogenase E1 component alpha subunit